MGYLFCFKFTPSNKILICIPFRITIILISIICAIFGIINFIGYLNFGEFDKNMYIYFYSVLSILAPLIFIYTAIKKDEMTNYIGYYFHTLYAIFINALFIIGIIVILIIDTSFFSKYSLLFIIQLIYNFFILFANFVFFTFNYHYSSLFGDDEVNIVSSTAYSQV